MSRIFTFFFLSFMIFMTLQRLRSTFFTRGKIKGEVVKGWTLYVLSIVHVLIGITTIVEYFWLVKRIDYFVTIIGILMYSVGVLGRAWARNSLGRYHSPQIEIRAAHPLIISGPYKYVRHPIYFFNIVELLGFPLVPNAYVAFLLALFVYTPLLILRLFFEEQVHSSVFGKEYSEYKSKVPPLIPFTHLITKKFTNLLLMGKS